MAGNESVFVPVLPSFDGFFSGLSKGAKKGGQQAGRDMASSMEKELRSAEKLVEKTAGVQERAQDRAETAAEKTRVAQLRLNEVMEKGTAKASEIAKATGDYNKAQRDQEAAAKAAERAVKQHEDAQNGLRKAADSSTDAIELSSKGLDEYEGALDGAGGQLKNFIGIAGGLAGVAGIGATLAEGMDVSGAIGNMNRQFGLTGVAAESAANDVSTVLKSGMVSSAEDAAGAIGALNGQFKYLGSEGEQTAGQLADNFLAFSRTFGVDIAEATQTAGQLITTGLAPDVETAADLMTAAMQRVPAAMQDELPEIINEYGVNFAALGYSGEEAFGILVNQAENGKWALDKTGDALKEFTIRGSDMSKASVGAFEAVGLNAEDMANKLATGGEAGREALELTAQKLLEMEDPAERANTAIALFGTPLEDLSVDQIPAFLEGLSGAEGAMNGFQGASQGMADEIANSLQGRLDALKGTVSSLAADAFMALWDMMQNKVVPALQTAGDWIQRNRTWLEPLAAVAGSVAVAMGGLAAAHALQSMWAGRAAFSTTLLGKAFGLLLGHPIIAAIAAIAGGLIYFFTQTETGQEMWGKFTDFLGSSWDVVTEKIGGGIDWIVEKWDAFTGWISTAWDGITSLISGDYTGAMSEAFGIEEDSPIIGFFFGFRDAVFGALEWVKGAWTSLGDAVSATYEGFIKPVFEGFMTAGKILFAVVATAVLTPLMITWNALSAAVSWGWENVIKPAWDMMTSAASWMWESVLQPVFGFIQQGWSLLADGVKWYYDNVILVAWSALQAAAQFMWTNVLMPVFGFISAGWDALANGLKWAYDNIILVAWSALQTAATWMWENVLLPVFGFIQARWETLSNNIRWAYDTIIKPAWDALSSALTWMYDTIIAPTFQWIGDRWNDMSNILEAGKTFIVDSVFGGLQRGLDVVKDAFRLAKDAIGEAWDGIKAKAAAPVKFVIESVFNNGIVEAWNKVADWVDLPTIDKYEPSWLGSYARGTASIVPGARSVNRDNINFVSTDGRYGIGLAGGEGIAHQHVVDGLGGKSAWDRLNYVGRTRGPGAVREELGSDRGTYRNLGGFSQGGVIDSIVGLVNQYFPGMGISSTVRPGENNHHGWGEAVDVSNQVAGGPSTPAMQAVARFFHDNYAPMLAELIHWPLNGWNNIDEGVPYDFGPGTNAGHTDHVHIASRSPLPAPGSPIEPISVAGGGGGVINWLRNKVADTLDGIFGPIGSAIPDLGGMIGGLPKAAFDKMTGAVSDFIRGKADVAGTGSGVDTSGVVGSNVEIGQQLAARVGWTGAEWEALKELWTLESNWDNNAQNPTSTAYGIPQFLDQTWGTVGYGKTSDPATQIAAGIKYIQQRPDYGGLPSKALAAWWSRNPHWYDQGGEARGRGLLPKDTIRPERVLSPEQTEAFNDWMRGTPQGESAAVVARELAEAFRGGDWGMGELASYIGQDLAASTLEVVASIGRLDRGFREWWESEDIAEARGKFAEDSTDAMRTAGRSLATESLDLVGAGALVDIAEGVGGKVHGILQDEEVQEAMKTVQLDPDMSYSGREIEKKLRELGVDVERIKSQLSGSVLGGLVGMA